DIRNDEKITLRIEARQNVFQQPRKVFQILCGVSKQKKLGQRKLTFTQDPETGDQRFTAVTFLDYCRTQGMKTSFTIRPQIANAGHHQRKKWGQQLLQVVADEEVLLTRLAHYSRWIDGVAAMENGINFKHGIVVLQRVVAIVIAERSFRETPVRRRLTYQRKLRFGGQSMRPVVAQWIFS